MYAAHSRIDMVFCALLLSLSASPTEWPEYRSPEGDFIASFPGTPQTEARPRSQNSAVFRTELNVQEMTFTVVKSEPTRRGRSADVELESLRMTRDDLVANLRAKILDESEITVNGARGLELTAQTLKEGIVWKIRVILGPDWDYIVSVANCGGAASRADADRFLTSFRPTIYKPPAPPRALIHLPWDERTNVVIACVVLGLGLCYVVWHIFFWRK